MIKAQQQQLLVSSAMDYLNCPVVVKLLPIKRACKEFLDNKKVNPYL